MNDLVKFEKHAIQENAYNPNRMVPSGKELMEVMETTKLLANCQYYQKLGPHGILAIWLTAREMGLPPMMCLNGGMYTFSGQVSLSAQMMNMMLVNSGHRADVLELSDTTCKIRFWRKDRPKDNCTFEYAYTIEMARTAGLTNKANWKTNARDMLYNRCLSGGARKFMPDVIMGAYLIGELPDDESVIDVIPGNISIPAAAIPAIQTSDVKPLYISEKEAAELTNLINDCSEEKQEKIWAWINTKCNNDIHKFPKECYANTRKVILERRAEHQLYLKELKTLEQLNQEAEETGENE